MGREYGGFFGTYLRGRGARLLAALLVVAAAALLSAGSVGATAQFANGTSPVISGCDVPPQDVETMATVTIYDPAVQFQGHANPIGTAALKYSPECGTSWVDVFYPDALGAPGYKVFPSVWQENTTDTTQHTDSDTADFPNGPGGSEVWTSMVDADGVATCGGVQTYRDPSLLLDGTSSGASLYVGWTYIGCRYASSPVTLSPPTTTTTTTTTTTPTTSNPAASLSQGPVAPEGYRYAIGLTGFAANASVAIECYDSVSPGGFFSFTLQTDANGEASTDAYCYSGDGPDHWVVAGGVESNHVSWGSSSSPPTDPAPAPTYEEGAGPSGATTFLDYSNESGVGQRVGDYQQVQVTCRVQGLPVSPDGNPWYYRIASSPWSNAYYASADPFYNTPGMTSGSLKGTPFVDTSVPTC